MYSIHVIKFVTDLWQVHGFYRVLPFSSSNKIDHYDITEKLLKVALNTITLTLTLDVNFYVYFYQILTAFNNLKIMSDVSVLRSHQSSDYMFKCI